MSDIKDIVAVGLDLKPKTLLQAYSQGVFPWPTEGLPLLWYCPQKRAVLEFDRLNISRRLKQYLKKNEWTYTVDRAFDEVIEACSDRGEDGTWILPEMKEAYQELHRLGHAHSIEVWNKDELVGGLYGVDSSNYFAGESMFHREDHASKAALLFAISLLRKAGRDFMDIQVMTPHLAAFGAREISRTQFLKKLLRAQESLKLSGPTKPFREHQTFNYEEFSQFLG